MLTFIDWQLKGDGFLFFVAQKKQLSPYLNQTEEGKHELKKKKTDLM